MDGRKDTTDCHALFAIIGFFENGMAYVNVEKIQVKFRQKISAVCGLVTIKSHLKEVVFQVADKIA
jgi:hypothetical protein